MVYIEGIGTGIVHFGYRKKVSVSVSAKSGTGKKYRYRYRQNLVPEKSIGIGIAQNYGYRHTLHNTASKCVLLVFDLVPRLRYDKESDQ